MKKILSVILIAVMVCLTFAGCSSKTTSNETETSSDSDVIVFTDSCGREVEIPTNIEKIAPSGSLAQQILLTIVPNKLVGLSAKLTDNETNYLGSDLASLPVFGQFYGTGDLNMEALASASPQIIIDMGDYKDGIAEDMDSIQKQLGIPTIFIEASLDKMGEAYKTLGKLLGAEEQGNKLSQYCDDVYNNINTTMATIPESDRVNFVYASGENGLSVIGKGSYHAEVLDILGNNLAVLDNPSNKGTGDQISADQMMLWNPDVVIFAPKSIYNTVKTDAVWQDITAIKNSTYYEVPSEPYNWIGMPPSINRYLGMQWLANLFYPEIFDYNMYTVAKEYYKLFYNYDMTEDEFNSITANAVK